LQEDRGEKEQFHSAFLREKAKQEALACRERIAKVQCICLGDRLMMR